MSTQVGRNAPCPCGSGKKYKRCCLDDDKAAARARVQQPAERRREKPRSGLLSLVVETEAGLFVRRVPDASPLHPDSPVGLAAEEATSDAASIWGLPDFVFRAELLRVGSGVRERGDGIVIAGPTALAVQVKSRAGATADQEKERKWLEKKIATALSQASGTIRTFRRVPTEVRSRRGQALTVDGAGLRWTPVVVVDHPDPPPGFVPKLAGAKAAVVLLRRDWEFLFEQLKSTSAVIAYLERVAGEAVALGEEPVRYYELAQADAEAPPGPVNESVFGGRGEPRSTPLLPLAPLDPEAGRLVRLILEDVAVAGIDQAPEDDRLQILAELDRLPVGYREETGRFLAEALKEVSGVSEGVMWRLRQMVGPDETALLGFAACSEYNDEIRAAFQAWLSLRHHQLADVTGRLDELTSTGVLLTPRPHGKREWDTTVVMVKGEVPFTSEELELFESVWGPPGTSSVTI